MIRRFILRLLFGEDVFLALQIRSVERLDLRPGDLLVIKSAPPLSFEMLDRIKAYWSARLPNTRIVLCDPSVSLEVIGKADAEASPSAMVRQAAAVEEGPADRPMSGPGVE